MAGGHKYLYLNEGLNIEYLLDLRDAMLAESSFTM